MVLEATSGNQISHFTTGRNFVYSIAFSPDGYRVATGNWDATAIVFDAASGKRISSLTHRGTVFAVVFSPDGRWVATASDDNSARVFDAATGKELLSLAHQETVRAVTFSTDGLWVATGSSDHTARVFEAASGKEVSRMTLSGPVRAVRFTEDGLYLMTASEETSPQELILTRHFLHAQNLIDDACSRLTRNLTPEEWKLYAGSEVPYHKTCPNLP